MKLRANIPMAAVQPRLSPSLPPAGGGEGRGEEARLVELPLSSVLFPLVPRGARRKNGHVPRLEFHVCAAHGNGPSGPSRLRGGTTNPERHARSDAPCQRGLSLVEMMVAVALLAVIIIGLVAMLEQTRKAFTAGLANVDYQDSGRVALDLIARDLQQMAPANTGIVYATAGTFSGTNALNFFSTNDPTTSTNAGVMITVYGDRLTNTFQRLFFTTQYNQTSYAVGYWLNTSGQPPGVGTLYQYRAVGPAGGAGSGQPLLNDFYNFPADTNAFSPVIDGVVSFRVRAYDPNGNLITNGAPNIVAAPMVTSGDYSYAFSGNVVPAYVEIELTVLENKTLDRYRSMHRANAAAFWNNHIGQMHVFKQRVSIASLDRTAFP